MYNILEVPKQQIAAIQGGRSFLFAGAGVSRGKIETNEGETE